MITPLDPNGKQIIYGQQPYHNTALYKDHLQQRIVNILQSKGEEDPENEAHTIINTYTQPATQQERDEISKSIKEDVILPFDLASLSMFNSDMLMKGVSYAIDRIQDRSFPSFLYLGSAQMIGKKKSGGREVTLGDIETDIGQYNNQIVPTLNADEHESYNTDPYIILLKVNYIGQDDGETLPLHNQPQGRKKYDINFVALENTHKTPGKTLIDSLFAVNIKTMNQDTFMTWFADNKNDITIPSSLKNIP